MPVLELRPLAASCGVLVMALCIHACKSSEARQPPGNVINIGVDAGTFGCSQRTFPPEQPDLSALTPPIFLLTTLAGQQSTTGQAQVDPGDPIEAEIWVNSATRNVTVELANAWAEDDIIYTTDEETAGNTTVPVFLFSESTIRGRYYMRLTLCGNDCSEREVVFDIHPCEDGSSEPCGINAPYDRTVIEQGEIVQVDGTCVDLGGTPGVGSGTVLIQ